MARRIIPYIPYSTTLTWQDVEAAAGGEVRVHTAFVPGWYTSRTPFDYGKRWHDDPEYRRQSLMAMGGVLERSFPELELGRKPRELPGSISQAYTTAVMAALFGQEIVYRASDWPDNYGPKLTDEQAEELAVPEIESHWLYKDLMKQLDEVESRWGSATGILNYQGVLNTAFRLRGQSIFIDMLDNPERAHHVLSVVCDTMVRFVDAIYARCAESGTKVRHFVTSNCVVNMISGAQYIEFILPYDTRLAEHYEFFGIHNCGWSVDAYVEPYAGIGKVTYLDFGIDSDLAKIRRYFDERVTLSPIFNPTDISGKSQAEMRKVLERIHAELGVCHPILGAMDDSVPLESIRGFYRLVSEIWHVPQPDLVPPFADAF